MRAKLAIVALAVLIFLSSTPLAWAEPFREWQPVGPGGGGGNFRGAVSPIDTSLYFAACDMGGFYRSTNAGIRWAMVDGVAHTTMTVVFDPFDPNVCYVGHRIGSFMNNGWALSRSDDQGATWRRVYSFTGAYETNAPTCLVMDPDEPSRMFVGMSGILPGRILKSETSGHDWKASDSGIPANAQVRAIYILPGGDPGARALLAITDLGPYSSADDGSTWTAAHAGLSGARIVKWSDVQAGLSDSAHIIAWSASVDLEAGRVTAYVATPVEAVGGSLTGGLYKSDDGGASWTRTTSPVDVVFQESKGARVGRLTAIAANDVSPQTLYCCLRVDGNPYRSGIWKSTDGGATWAFSLPGPATDNIMSDKRGYGSNVSVGWLTETFGWSWGGEPAVEDQLYACKSDPDIVLVQDDGRTIGTRDGGATWQQLYTDNVGRGEWTSRGYEVTTCYKVYWSPADYNRMYIAYTDIGLFRSEDGGRSWMYSLRGSRHTNTVYDLAIDPDKPFTMFAAVSSSHDMPAWKTLVPGRYYSKGGVSMTVDGGRTWTPMGEKGGLPNSSVGRVVIDPKTPVGNRTLYVTSWGYGVYKSTDGGQTWAAMNNGIDTQKDYNFWRMSMAADGSLYVITTKIINKDGENYTFDSGAIYRSDDGAKSWTLCARGGWMAYPWDVECDPSDPNTVYVATEEDPHVEPPALTPGGLYRSTDRGKTWARILPARGPQRVTIDPADTKVIYVSTEDEGVYRTADGGIVWNRLQGPPFRNCYGISIDPKDRETIFVTTFGGGVWKGSAYGSGYEPEGGFAIDTEP